MKPTRDIILLALFSFFLASTSRAEIVPFKTAQGKEFKSAKSVLVRYKDIGRRVFKPSNTIPKIGVDVLPVPANETLGSFIAKLKADPNVLSAEPNSIVRASFNFTDPVAGQQYYLGANYVNLGNALDITQGSNNTVIAVLDTGVTLGHDDLDDNLWDDPDSPGVHGATMRLDWNGDGDCLDPDVFFGPEMCPNSTPNDDNSSDNTYHGTRVAGVIAAETNNGLDVSGVCPNCEIMAVKVLNSEGYGTEESIVDGIIFAVDSGADIINMSLGGPTGSAAEEAAVNYAYNNGVLVVAASGNCLGCTPCAINYPAAFPNVISVGATDNSNELADHFSCGVGPLDLVAPGDGIRTLTNTENTTDNIDGTSFASPIVAGVAGLMLSLDPSLTPSQITRHLNYNADDLGSSGYDTTFGFGRVDALNALLAVQNGTTYPSNPGFPNESFPEPNPFYPRANGVVKINVPIPIASATDKKIILLNMSGEEVKTIHCPGECEWDGKNDSGGYVASGIYYYRLESSQGNTKGKITVIK